MPVPTSYDESTLAAYMRTVIGPLADVLGWTETAAYAEPIAETLLALAIADLADVTDRRDIQRLRAVARREVWRAVAGATAGNYRFSTDQQSFDRQQVYEHAQAEYQRAARECQALGIGGGVAGAITTIPVRYAGECV